jgi:hypothetical protein
MGYLTNKELCEAIGELMHAMQVPRSIGMLERIPDVKEKWDAVHRELGFGYPSAHDYAIALETRFDKPVING